MKDKITKFLEEEALKFYEMGLEIKAVYMQPYWEENYENTGKQGEIVCTRTYYNIKPFKVDTPVGVIKVLKK